MLASTLCFSIIALGFVGITRDYRFLFAFAGWIFMYAIFSKIRNMILKSGMVFSIFLALTAGAGILFFNKYFDLKFYVLLVTLSLVVLSLKIRKSGMKQILPTDFIKTLIDRLKNNAWIVSKHCYRKKIRSQLQGGIWEMRKKKMCQLKM